MKPSFLLFFMALCTPGFAGWAQNAASRPVGVVSLSLPAANHATTRFLSAPLSAPPSYRGSTDTVGGNTISLNTPAWTDGQFTVSPHYVRVLTGAEAGRTLFIIANTAVQLTVDISDHSKQDTPLDTAGFALAPGDRFEIVASRTLGNLFGPTAASLALIGGEDTETADSVGLWNARKQRFAYYYFHSGAGRWVLDGDANLSDQANAEVAPDTAFAITRPAARGASQLDLVGVVPVVAPLLKVAGHETTRYYGTGLPMDVPLGELDLGGNWQRGHNPAKADTISFYRPAKEEWFTFHQTLDGPWMTLDNDGRRNAKLFHVGQGAAFVNRRNAQGAASFLRVALPYEP